MLWADADFVSAADLLSEDPDIQDAADSLGLTLGGSNGAIRRGIEEAGRYLENALVSFTTYLSSNDLSANHLAAVFYTGSMPNQRRRFTLAQIVVSGQNANYWSECKIWAMNWVLKRFYISAANKSETDRYSTKRDFYIKRESVEMWPSFKQSGIPVVFRPMPAPDQAQARNAGTWLASLVNGTGTVTVAYDVAVSYVDQSLYVDQNRPANAEGQPSQVQTLTMVNGKVIKADITNLNPPNGAINLADIARGFVVPRNATGWNLWAGVSGQTLHLQNATPIPIATKTFTLPGDPILTGFSMGQGQYADALVSIHNLVKRA